MKYWSEFEIEFEIEFDFELRCGPEFQIEIKF